jgi:hypothetical protein
LKSPVFLPTRESYSKRAQQLVAFQSWDIMELVTDHLTDTLVKFIW